MQFFKIVQNKLHYAVTGKTAAEIIVERADANKPNMNLTSWKGTIVRKQDIFTAKNYLTENEIDTLNRLVVIFLESAELRAKNRMDITMNFWRENVDKILEFQDKKILTNFGSISKPAMEKHVRAVYADFDKRRKKYDALQADKDDMEELKQIENEIKKRE